MAASGWSRRLARSSTAQTLWSPRRAVCSITWSAVTSTSRRSKCWCSMKPTGCSTWDSLPMCGALGAILKAKPAGQTLIFTRTKYGADKLVTFLRREGITANALHGDKAQSTRTRTLDQFRSGTAENLVATDIAARGIDVDGIRMVVNYDVPTDPEVYVHRVGRTARAGARGLALTLISPDEWLLMADVERLIGQTFPREVIPGFEPSVPPLQPRIALVEAAKPERSLRPRRGATRRR